MDILGFIMNNWILTLVVVIAIAVVVKIIKDMIKGLLLALLIVVGFLTFMYYNTGEAEPVEVSQERQEEIQQLLNLKLMKVPVETVQYSETNDGRFTVQANGMVLTGTWKQVSGNVSTVKVTESGQTIELVFSETMKSRVAQIKAQSKQ